MTSPERPEQQAITSPRSDRVRRIASLSGRSARRRHGLLRVEGPQAVRSLLAERPDVATELFLTDRAAADHPELTRLARSADIPHRVVGDDVLRAMVRDDDGSGGMVSPQGAVATARPVDRPLDDALAALPTGPVSVAVLHDLRDPGNVGTLLRTADAAGAALVILTAGSADPHAPKVVRASAGSLFHVPVVVGADPATLLETLRGAGLAPVATSGYAPQDLFAAALPSRVAWLFGNEAHGLPTDVIDASDLAVRIPLAGRAESLNVTTAATVCLFEQLRRHHPTPTGTTTPR
ncbi:RNA methyltransferase [Brachybacterium sp. EF45031]|uniref:TrmH family RNA methyltransferase n=1 Tax=Brachybacterium sillae TaxID=2810536 RepID=UPI00255985A1|nr:RNA methyltransferase [Brachybacterium sillae]MCS6711111.1 RNA methyltransferase [Brachybacterium sillae]